jgi:hypothetical protein
MIAAPSHCLTVTRGGRSTSSGVCGKHTMVILQIRLQASKQLDQSGSENAATVYHGLPNDTKKMTKSIVALHDVTHAPQRIP